jgi:hypothetical protein
MQEHTPVSAFGCSLRDVLVVLPAGRRRIKVLMLVGWSRPRGGSPHCGFGPVAVSDSLWPNRPPACCLHLVRPARMSGRIVMSLAFVQGWQVAGPVASTCSRPSRNVRNSVDLDPSSSCHIQGAVTIHGAVRAESKEPRRFCGFLCCALRKICVLAAFFSTIALSNLVDSSMSTCRIPPFPEINQALSADDWLKRINSTLEHAAAGESTLTLEQVLTKLRELAPGATVPSTPVVSERMTHGYKVRRSYAQISEEERKARKAITLQAIAQALAQLRSH